MTIYISKEQYEKLKKELENLKTVERKKIAERIKTAIEFGDISENAEYDIAMSEKENLERKIIELENILKTAKIIRNVKNSDRILPGITFEAVEKNNNKKYTFTLVGFGESDPLNGKISTDSPVGRAFLNKKVGEVVKVQTPKGEVTYVIKKILNS
jgi:transcription elongation factor GreA